MSRLINWNDKYCPNGHKWVFCPTSTLYPDFYYCKEEDRFWEPTVRPIKTEEVKKNFNPHRPDEMRKYALRELALEKIQYTKSFNEIIAFAEVKS